ncbi:sigma-54-dependent Fis family transcriptional regulator [Pseudonocardia xishanensis]|uniref:sigma-54-dependent Fis family transcriptional regulator n=1 Tax=Pseudonocardia xishanensis TaxID=630995 RepID=UPI0031E9DA82
MDSSSRFLVAATPVIDELASRLNGYPVCLMVADRDGNVVHQWSGDDRLRGGLESHGVVFGAGLTEHLAGTNAVGTALEVGHAVAINGAEHFLHSLRSYSCFGHPIRHPLTRRIEGILDITAAGPESNPMFGPLLAGAVRDIEARIIEGAREEDRRLFIAFQNATRLRSTPVAVLGGDTVLANRACLDRLGSVDPAILSTLTAEVLGPQQVVRNLDLGERGRIRVLIERLEGTSGGALFYLGDLERASLDASTGEALRLSRSVVIAGEPGTGRTTQARRLAGNAGAVTVDAVDALTGSERAWAARFQEVTAGTSTPVIVDDVHLLPERLCEVVRRALVSRTCAPLILTSCPTAELAPPAARAVALCEEQIELTPLRERVHELPSLIESIAAERRTGVRLRFTPRALTELAAQPWSGNLSELARLVDDVLRAPIAGDVDAPSLPARYRSSARAAGLGGRERAERAALITALQASHGNKMIAARQLGISRTTLYRRMQALDVQG